LPHLQILQCKFEKIKGVRKFSGLRFAELFCVPPTFELKM
jgi:hypothetical protein